MRNDVSLSQLHFIELLKFQFLGLQKKIGSEYWVVCDTSKSNVNFTKDVNETLRLNAEPREESLDQVVKAMFTFGYYCLHIILFEPNLIIRLRFDALPTTVISMGNETPNSKPS